MPDLKKYLTEHSETNSKELLCTRTFQILYFPDPNLDSQIKSLHPNQIFSLNFMVVPAIPGIKEGLIYAHLVYKVKVANKYCSTHGKVIKAGSVDSNGTPYYPDCLDNGKRGVCKIE